MNIYEKLLNIQVELKAPKSQYNKFGNYNYRSCEDILEAVKPIAKTHNAVVTVSDRLVWLGDRYYIEATATLTDIEGEHLKIENTAYARESQDKKGMDDSQITGTASSYARKYALNGLFCIDDTKDADTDEFNKTKDEQVANQKVTETQAKAIYSAIMNKGRDLNKFLEYFKIKNTNELTLEQYAEAMRMLDKE